MIRSGLRRLAGVTVNGETSRVTVEGGPLCFEADVDRLGEWVIGRDPREWLVM